jgi:hypothetical protein
VARLVPRGVVRIVPRHRDHTTKLRDGVYLRRQTVPPIR